MIRRPPRSTLSPSSAASDVYKRQAWNNTLSVAQQSVIMHRHGAKIELFDNLKRTWEALKNLFTKKKSDAGVSGSSS